MRAYWWIILLLGGTAGGVGGQAPPVERAGLGEVIRREMLSRAAPGAVVAVVRGDTVEVEAVGHLDAARTVPMTADRLFGTGELGQVIAGLAAARLGVGLDGPIARWAPDLPPRIGALTLEQLLTNTAGLDDARDEPPRRGPGPAMWPGATDRALFTEPGALYSSTRHGPPLARAVLTAAGDAPSFGALADALVFEAAGMDRSTFDGARADALGAAPGLVVSTRADVPMRALQPRESPVDQLYSTAGDLGALLAAGLTASGVLRDAFAFVTRARVVRPSDPRDSIGAGVRISRFAGRRMAYYEGGIGGYGTVVRWLPDERVGVVVLANATGATLARTADGLLRFALGVADTTAPAGASAPPRAAPAADSAYTGTWANGDRILVIEQAGDGLVWADGELRLDVRREGGRLDVLVGDGRVAQTLRWYADDDGRAYLLVGDLAYARQPPARRRGLSASGRR